MKNKKHPSENWIREFHKAAESTTNSLNTILSQIGLYVVEVPHDFSNDDSKNTEYSYGTEKHSTKTP